MHLILYVFVCTYAFYYVFIYNTHICTVLSCVVSACHIWLFMQQLLLYTPITPHKATCVSNEKVMLAVNDTQTNVLPANSCCLLTIAITELAIKPCYHIIMTSKNQSPITD